MKEEIYGEMKTHPSTTLSGWLLDGKHMVSGGSKKEHTRTRGWGWSSMVDITLMSQAMGGASNHWNRRCQMVSLKRLRAMGSAESSSSGGIWLVLTHAIVLDSIEKCFISPEGVQIGRAHV